MQYDFLSICVVLSLMTMAGEVGVAISRKARGRMVFPTPLTAKDTAISVGFGVAGIIIGMLIEGSQGKFLAVWSSPLTWALAICYGVIITADVILDVRERTPEKPKDSEEFNSDKEERQRKMLSPQE
jgi:hypothetical protein